MRPPKKLRTDGRASAPTVYDVDDVEDRALWLLDGWPVPVDGERCAGPGSGHGSGSKKRKARSNTPPAETSVTRTRKKNVCAEPGCATFAQRQSVGSKCFKHGFGIRCDVPGCAKLARRGAGSTCVMHGGGLRCDFPDCGNSAVGGTGADGSWCVAHGGGLRCDVPDCGNSAVGGTRADGSHRCSKHGPRCEHPGYSCAFAQFCRGAAPTMCARHGGGLSAEQLRDRDEQRARQAVLRAQQLEEKALGWGAPTADEKAEAAALYNGMDPRLWSPQFVILAHMIAPDVAAKLLHFNEALGTALTNGHAPRAAFSPKVQAAIVEIQRAVQPAILEAGERAFDGLLPRCYLENATPEEKRQRALHRGLLALLILYSPLRRRKKLGRSIEVLAIWRHVEMYINADPDAITPSGDLLTSTYHAGQHAAQREEHSKRGHGVGGYVAFIEQRRGCSPRDGGTRPGTNGSVNIMTGPFELCVRALDRVVGPPPAAGGLVLQTQFLAEGGDMVDELGDDHGETRDYPVDLIGGALFLGCVDLRPESAGGDPDWLLELVLRAPLLRKRISTSEAPKELEEEQMRVRAQPQAEEMLGFLRLDGESHKAYTSSVLDALGVPMDGTPAFCYDTVDYAAAMKQRPLGKFKP
jgi:hypothetical protein